MIKRLKKKFIVLAMTMLVILVFLIVATMNVINYVSVVSEADSTLSMLSSFSNVDFDFTDIPDAQDIPGIGSSGNEGGLVFDEDAGARNPGDVTPGENDQGALNPGGGDGNVTPDANDPGAANPGGNQAGTGDMGAGQSVPGAADQSLKQDPGAATEGEEFVIDGEQDIVTPETDESGNLKKPEDFQGMMEELGKMGMEDRMPGNMNVEVAYESRFFSVSIDSEGNISSSDLSMTASVTEDDLDGYVKKALSKGGTSGFAGNFRYCVTTAEEGENIIFLDCGRKLGTFYRFLLISSLVGLGGCLIAFLVFLFASGRIVKPISDSYEKQKMFITDASHEIKTPLTVISANLELLRSENADSECVNDISAQITRLTALTNDLVALSRMEEGNSGFTPVEFPASECVDEAAAGFRNAVSAAGKKLTLEIQPLISINGDSVRIQRLVGILLENALKYSSPASEIRLSFEKRGKNAVLSVSNKVNTAISQQDLERLFDRFYRADKSRSSAEGGHGIGLSIARQITELHKGRISAAMQSADTFVITASFPL